MPTFSQSVEQTIRARLVTVLQLVQVVFPGKGPVLPRVYKVRNSIPLLQAPIEPTLIVFPPRKSSVLTRATPPPGMEENTADFAIEGFLPARSEDLGSFGEQADDLFDKFKVEVRKAVLSDETLIGYTVYRPHVVSEEDIIGFDAEPDMLGFSMILQCRWRCPVTDPTQSV